MVSRDRQRQTAGIGDIRLLEKVEEARVIHVHGQEGLKIQLRKLIPIAEAHA